MDSPHSGPIDQVAWYSANSEDETHPVGQKKPNAWGLYDMQGNVREWVSDFYSSNYYSVSPAADPTGAQLGGDRGGPWSARTRRTWRSWGTWRARPRRSAGSSSQRSARRVTATTDRCAAPAGRGSAAAGSAIANCIAGGPISRRAQRTCGTCRTGRSGTQRHQGADLRDRNRAGGCWTGWTIHRSTRWPANRPSGGARWRLGSIRAVPACVCPIQLLRPDVESQRYRLPSRSRSGWAMTMTTYWRILQ
jgi:hypothetical protein